MLCEYLILVPLIIGDYFRACQALASEHKIYDAIFKDYNKNIRPVKDINSRTFIEIAPQWLVLFEVDTAKESVSFNMDYTQTWKDEFLQWDPSNFDGIETINIPEDMIWLPDVCLVYSYELTSMIPKQKQKARLTYDGNVTIWNPNVVTYHCGMVIDNFPFDSQTCSITLSPWTLTLDMTVAIALPVSPDDLSTQFRGNPEWTMLSFVTKNKNLTIPDGAFSEAIMVFTIKRNSVYYVGVLIIPTFVITSLCLLGIFAPFSSTGDREEKVTLGLTTLLTISVILSSVAGELPKSSKLPIIGWFIIAEMAMCTAAILLAVLVMFLHQRAFLHLYTPPRCLLRVLQGTIAPIIDENIKSSLIPLDRKGSAKNMHLKIHDDTLVDEIRDVIVMLRKRIEKEASDELLRRQWNMIIDCFDFILLIIFQAANVLLSLLILL